MKTLTRNEFLTLLVNNPGKKFVFQEDFNNDSCDPAIHITSGNLEYPAFGAFYIDTHDDDLLVEYDWDIRSDYTDADMFNVFDENDIKEVVNILSSAIYSENEEDCISRQAVLSMQYRIDDSATLSTRDVVNVDDIEDLPSIQSKYKKAIEDIKAELKSKVFSEDWVDNVVYLDDCLEIIDKHIVESEIKNDKC